MDILYSDPTNSNPQKRCTGPCGRTLPATPEFFQRNRASKDGLRPDCKDCRKQYLRRPDVQERTLAYNRAYYADQENRDRILAQRKYNYHNDPDVKQYARDYNKLPKSRERNKAYLKEYNKTPAGKAKNKANKHRYRAQEKMVAGTHTAQQIQDLLERQKHKCYYCKKKFAKKDGEYVYNIEHTYPISRVAGTDIPANDISYLVLACYPCNRDKGNKFPWEWPEGGRLL